MKKKCVCWLLLLTAITLLPTKQVFPMTTVLAATDDTLGTDWLDKSTFSINEKANPPTSENIYPNPDKYSTLPHITPSNFKLPSLSSNILNKEIFSTKKFIKIFLRKFIRIVIQTLRKLVKGNIFSSSEKN